jgi:cation diffusion facilitator CzcD-associated flavoprotein CzcO
MTELHTAAGDQAATQDADAGPAHRLPAADATGEPRAQDLEVLILGAGVSGIAAAIGLRQAGFEDFVIVERGGSVGGTWHHNTYPGCACDIPSHLYSFSYALNPEWQRVFATQPEIEAYILRVAAEYDLAAHLSAQTELLDARWDDPEQRWIVRTTRGTYRARTFIIGAGPLHEPIIPDLPGLSSFRGELFHSSRWPADLDLSGRRVVVVGTGASAIQFVPEIQPHVEHLTILQRTPSWVMPKLDWRTSRLERRLLRRLPFLMRGMRLAQWAPMDLGFLLMTRHPRWARLASVIGRLHMRRAIKDRDLRRRLTPDYAVTCKRLGLSNNFYPALAQPNVAVLTSPASEIREASVVTADGTVCAADTIILGTGFHVLTHHPVADRIRGRDGRTLAETWNGSPKAYMGTTMAGFPNAFMMFGPNAGTLSGFVMAEAQTDYVIGAITAMRREGLTSIDVRPEEQEAFVQEVDRVLEGSTFLAGGCNSYYLDDTGRVALAWPWTMTALRRRLARFDLRPYATRTVDRARLRS